MEGVPGEPETDDRGKLIALGVEGPRALVVGIEANRQRETGERAFVTQVKNLLVPIFAAEQRYGLKKRHLRKFKRSVEQFYEVNIDVALSNCEVVAKYQKRFARYRDSLFTFLESDGIPWHNNTAENAIRHLAVQRKISGTFFKNAVPQYLLLLGVAQTCRFQGKSVLRFFSSEQLDIDAFKAVRRIKRSYLIDRCGNVEEDD